MAEAFLQRLTLDGTPVYLLQILSSDKMAHVLKSDGLTGLLGRNDFYKAALDLLDKNKQDNILTEFCPVYSISPISVNTTAALASTPETGFCARSRTH